MSEVKNEQPETLEEMVSEETLKETSEEPKDLLEEYIDILYKTLCDIIEKNHITAVDTAKIVLLLMQTVEQFSDLCGSQKKELILRVIDKYDNEHPTENNFLTESLEGFVTSLVMIEKGEISIKLTPASGLSACLSCFLSKADRNRIANAKKAKKKNKLLAKKTKLENKIAKLE